MDFKNLEQLKQLKKKDFKSYINQNGGFIKMEINKLTTDKGDIPSKYSNDVPEGATYYEGIASNGDLNMNGYIIRPKAWKPAIKNYMEDWGGKVYYLHDMDISIGQTLEAKVKGDELWVYGYVFDELTEGRISKGLTTDLSTGHYTLDYEFQNAKDDGEVISKEEFAEKVEEIKRKAKDFDDYRDNLMKLYDQWILAVTKLIWVEYSFVNVGSNKSAEIKYTNNADAILNIHTNSADAMEEAKKEFLEFKKNQNNEPTKEIEDQPNTDIEGGDETEKKEGETVLPSDEDGSESNREGGEEKKSDEENSDEQVNIEEEDEKEDLNADPKKKKKNKPAEEITLEDDEDEEDEDEEHEEENIEEKTEENNENEEEKEEEKENEEKTDENDEKTEENEDSKAGNDDGAKVTKGDGNEQASNDSEDKEELPSNEKEEKTEENEDKTDDKTVEKTEESKEEEKKDDSVDVNEHLEKIDEELSDEKEEEEREKNNGSNDGDDKSGNEGEKPEAKKDNDLGKQIEQLKATIEANNKEINEYKKALNEADKLMENAGKLIDDQAKKINELEVFVEKARQITMKNGLYSKHEDKQSNQLLEDMKQAYTNHFG